MIYPAALLFKFHAMDARGLGFCDRGRRIGYRVYPPEPGTTGGTPVFHFFVSNYESVVLDDCSHLPQV